MDNDPQYKTDDGCALRIWRDAAPNNFLTGSHGRPVFDDVIFVEVIAPGSQGSTPVFEVKRTFHEDMNMEPLFGMQYEQFKKYIVDFERGEDNDKTLAGTPLKEWSEISRTFAASLKVAGIHSVEALASLPDGNLSVVGPDGRTWRTKAQAFLEQAKDSSHATRLAAELQNMRDEREHMRKEMADMAAKLSAAQAANTAVQSSAAPAKSAKTTEALKDII